MRGPVWLIGCGNMAGAMLSRWLETGLDPSCVTVVRPSGAPVAEGVRVVTQVPDEPPPELLMLGVKPQMLAAIAPGVQAASSGALVVSILAGTELATLCERFPNARAVVRVMPNMPVASGKGVVALHGALSPADRIAIGTLMAPLGLVEWIGDESLMDAATALAGSGPAFVYRFIDALAKGGTALGLPSDQAVRLALATAEGAAHLASRADAGLTTLADRVASKGGSTRKGLDVLVDGDALNGLLSRTLAAAEARNAELAAASRAG